MLALAAALGASSAQAEKADKKKPKSSDLKGAKEDESLDLPIPKGQPQKGVKVPLYGADGKLRMQFVIGIGTYINEEQVKLERLRVETFREDGSRELDMDLPDAVYNRKTRTISSQTKVFIRREDFEVTGNSMAFNVETREGTLGGGVRMIIYNFGEDTTGTKEQKPTVEFDIKPTPAPKTPTDKSQPK